MTVPCTESKNLSQSSIDPRVKAQNELIKIFHAAVSRHPCEVMPSQFDQMVTLALQVPGSSINPVLVVNALVTGNSTIRQLVNCMIKAAPEHRQSWPKWLEAVDKSTWSQEDKNRVTDYILGTYFIPDESSLISHAVCCTAAQKELTVIFQDAVSGHSCEAIPPHFDRMVTLALQAPGRLIEPALVVETLVTGNSTIRQLVKRIIRQTAPDGNRLWAEWLQAVVQSTLSAEDKDRVIHYIIDTFESVEANALTLLHGEFPEIVQYLKQSRDRFLSEQVVQYERQLLRDVAHIYSAVVEDAPVSTWLRPRHIHGRSKSFCDLYLSHVYRTFASQRSMSNEEIAKLYLKMQCPPPEGSTAFPSWVQLVKNQPVSESVKQINRLGFGIDIAAAPITYEWMMTDLIYSLPPSALTDVRREWRRYSIYKLLTLPREVVSKSIRSLEITDHELADEFSRLGIRNSLKIEASPPQSESKTQSCSPRLPPLKENADLLEVLNRWILVMGDDLSGAFCFLNEQYDNFSVRSYAVLNNSLLECFTCMGSATPDFVDDLLQRQPTFAPQMLGEVMANLAQFGQSTPQLLDSISKRVPVVDAQRALGPLTKQWLAKPFEEWPAASSCYMVALCYRVWPAETFEMLIREFEYDPHNLLDPLLQHCQQLGAIEQLAQHPLQGLVARSCLDQVHRYIDPHKDGAFFWDAFLRICPDWKQVLTAALVHSRNSSLFGFEKTFSDARQLKWHLQQIEANLTRCGLLDEWVNSISNLDLKHEVVEALKG